ncbi:MAG: TrkH family potassium uptake protein [Alphaproteobacteria bacterium]
MNLRPVLYIQGLLLSILSISMVFPMLADIYFGYDDWKVFFVCIIFTAFFGGALVLSNRDIEFDISTRQAFILTNAAWIILPSFGALPFWLSSLGLSATDSFFEAMSGITTTGSTVITNLNYTPASILLWRAMLQWLGGIGIIIMAMSVLPFLKVGGMQIFRTELGEHEKALPRSGQLAGSIAIVYILLTVFCAFSYMIAGLEIFDAVAHAMTTISTGGFSTFDDSFDHFPTQGPAVVAIVFMALGGIPFVLYVKAARGNLSHIVFDSQVRWYFSIILCCFISIAIYLVYTHNASVSNSVVLSLFNVISVMTGTGYSHGDISHWGGFAIMLFFFLMAVGGCAGSTSCGIKIFRFQVLYSITRVQIKRLLHSNGVFLPHYDGMPLIKSIPSSVMGFVFVYGVSFSLLTLALSYIGIDFMTSVSGAMTSISNVGPGLGDIIGYTNTFQSLPNSAKWILCIGMLLGRLELFTILVMFSPRFWRY